MGEPGFLDDYLPYLLRRADQTLSAGLYDELSRHGVGRSEWRVLAVLEELGPQSVLDLAGAALSPQPTVTHAVGRLERRGLVSREPSASDRRQRIVSITPSGSDLTRALMVEAKQLESDALADVDGLAELMDQLRAVTAAVEDAVRNGPVSEEGAA